MGPVQGNFGLKIHPRKKPRRQFPNFLYAEEAHIDGAPETRQRRPLLPKEPSGAVELEALAPRPESRTAKTP